MKFERTVQNSSPSIIEVGGVQIYPWAMVLEGADLGLGVRVQSFSIVESGTVIGEGTTLHPHTLTTGNSVIGKNCFVSSFVGFIDRVQSTTENFRKTFIGDNVFIGTGAVIFPVRIGDGAVIGANATVMRDVKPGEKVHGIVKPYKGLDAIAKIVREYDERVDKHSYHLSSPYVHMDELRKALS